MAVKNHLKSPVRTPVRKDLLFLFAVVVGGVGVLFLVSFGIWRAFVRGGKDFDVFYHAWKLVLSGQGALIYQEGPDRFLYAPAFAWLLSPLALLPPSVALGVWCGLKLAVLGSFICLFVKNSKVSSQLEGRGRIEGTGWKLAAGIWSILFVARPILIDIEYGQVNLLILGVCFWGLLTHFDSERSCWREFLSWFALAFGAFAKLYPLPLLLVPWFREDGVPHEKFRWERYGVLACGVLMVLAPLVSQGCSGTWELFQGWRGALLARGLPLESHNQSFFALLHHYWSGGFTHTLSEHGALRLGFEGLSIFQIEFLSLSWSFLTSGLILAWIFFAERPDPLQWVAVLIGLLILPSHLVWKPYFVFSLPLAGWILMRGVRYGARGYWLLLFGIFLGINFTGFDFVGHAWGPQLEAASFLLLMHLVMLGVGAQIRHKFS